MLFPSKQRLTVTGEGGRQRGASKMVAMLSKLNLNLTIQCVHHLCGFCVSVGCMKIIHTVSIVFGSNLISVNLAQRLIISFSSGVGSNIISIEVAPIGTSWFR